MVSLDIKGGVDFFCQGEFYYQGGEGRQIFCRVIQGEIDEKSSGFEIQKFYIYIYILVIKLLNLYFGYQYYIWDIKVMFEIYNFWFVSVFEINLVFVL